MHSFRGSVCSQESHCSAMSAEDDIAGFYLGIRQRTESRHLSIVSS